MSTVQWQGPVCFMCEGTGQHFAHSNNTPMTPSRRDVPTGLRCPACNGHGRQPSDSEDA